MHAASRPLSATEERAVAWGTFSPRDGAFTAVPGLAPCTTTSFAVSDSAHPPLFGQSTCITWHPAKPTVAGGGEGWKGEAHVPSAAAQEGCVQANDPASATGKDPLATGDVPTRGAGLASSSQCEQDTAPPVTGCTGSLATPTCRRRARGVRTWTGHLLNRPLFPVQLPASPAPGRVAPQTAS